MKIPCTIIDDLMPLFIDGACSMDTKAAVEEHLSKCDICRVKYQNMTTVFLPEEVEVPVPKNEIVFKSKKAFKKIRRRWIISLLCVLFLFPITFLSVNQYRKEGICFTNLYDIYRTNAYLNAIKKGKYEKAFSYLDIAWNYNDLMKEPDMFSTADEFKKIELNGVTYYANEEILLNEYAQYTKDASLDTKEKEANFWMGVFQRTHQDSVLIPTEIYLENQDVFLELMEGYQDYFIKNNYKSSVLLELESGSYYYFSDYTENTINQMKESENIMKSFHIAGMPILPADVYSYSIKAEAASREAFDIFRSKCVDMGYETYYNNCKKEFLENMNQLKDRGVKIEYRFSNSYQTDEHDQLNYDLILSVDGKEIRGIGVILFSEHNSLRFGGGFSTSSTDPLFNEMHDLIFESFYIRGIDFYVQEVD